jgi:hypothetical protein
MVANAGKLRPFYDDITGNGDVIAVFLAIG